MPPQDGGFSSDVWCFRCFFISYVLSITLLEECSLHFRLNLNTKQKFAKYVLLGNNCVARPLYLQRMSIEQSRQISLPRMGDVNHTGDETCERSQEATQSECGLEALPLLVIQRTLDLEWEACRTWDMQVPLDFVAQVRWVIALSAKYLR